MTTVALRGTLVLVTGSKPSASANNPDSSSNEVSGQQQQQQQQQQVQREQEWHWKGLWAFGGSVAAATAQAQQPFHYQFQSPVHPSQVPIPGQHQQQQHQHPTPNDTMEDDDENDAAGDENDGNEAPSVADSADSQPPDTSEKSSPVKEATTNPAVAPDKQDANSQGQSPAVHHVQETTSNSVTENDPPVISSQNTAGNFNNQPQSKGNSQAKGESNDSGKNVPAAEEAVATQPMDSHSEKISKVTTPGPISTKNTFATVPDGDPAFTDAAVHHPNTPCPLSGQWKGFFQNAAGRPTGRGTIAKVQESFHLFLNATPGPNVKFSFDDTPLPPTVHRESLVHVRGTGTNPFGTFELVGYLDMTSMILEVQRQYVYIPPSPRKRNSSPIKRTGSMVTTRNKKSYFTRKRQPTWKRKSLEEQKEETQQLKRQRTSIGGKKGKTVHSPATSQPDQQGGSENSVGTLPDPEGGQSTTSLTDSTLVTGDISAELLTPTIASTIEGVSTEAVPTSTKRANSGNTPRKRSSSGGTPKSSASGASPNAPGGNSTASSGSSSSSMYIKLPPIGDPKKARWRAAHFLYYQRHDPEQMPQGQDASASVSSRDSGKTNTNGPASGATTTPNPKYVVYEGEMANGHREGRGLCLYSNDMLYEGEWRRNKEHGQGRLWTADRRRLIYEGEWERGRMQGQGTYYYYPTGNSSSSNATGNKGGNKKGSKTTPNASTNGISRYIGEFKENMRNGMGQYILPDGSVYNGQWSQGKMNGRGVFTWPDCSVYEGEFKDNQRHGQGLLKTSDGFVYDGMWVHNAMEGRGMARYPNGQTYEGLFAHGRREGRGTIHFTNGAVYEGRFRDDAVDGQGTMKMSRSIVVPNTEKQNQRSTTDDTTTETNDDKPDFMIPIFFQSDMSHIHTKAGFTAGGE